MTEKFNHSENEKHEAKDWPLIANLLLDALKEEDIESMMRILISYYKKLLVYTLDDEPSEKLKEGIIKNYNGQLNRAAVEAARQMKAASLTPERQVALELSMILQRIYSSVGNVTQSEFFEMRATTLRAQLAHLTEKDLKYNWTNPHRASIEAVGHAIVSIVKSNADSVAKPVSLE